MASDLVRLALVYRSLWKMLEPSYPQLDLHDKIPSRDPISSVGTTTCRRRGTSHCGIRDRLSFGDAIVCGTTVIAERPPASTSMTRVRGRPAEVEVAYACDPTGVYRV